jgi:hypothetical protein
VGLGAPVLVATDLDAGSVLLRRWPPRPLPVEATLVACGRPQPGVYSARVRPDAPPAACPTAVTVSLLPDQAARDVTASQAGRPVAAARAPAGVRAAALDLGRLSQGVHDLSLAVQPAPRGAAPSAAWPYGLRLAVGRPAPVAVMAGGASLAYLRAAVDPTGGGRPFRVVGELGGARVLVAGGDVPPPADMHRLPADCGALLFAGPEVAGWLRELRPEGSIVMARRPQLPADGGRGLLLCPDRPPAWREALEDLSDALAQADVLRPVALEVDGRWQVLARFSDGALALALGNRAAAQVLVVGFQATPQAAGIVRSGAFAALVQAALPQLLPPGPAAPDRNPPPAELAATAATQAEIAPTWGPGARVVPYTPGLVPETRRGAADLTPLLALAVAVLLMGEWLLAAALCGATGPQPT